MFEPHGDYYRTTKPITIRGIEIPADTIFDGASIPPILKSFTGGSFHPRVIIPALFHDYCYRTGMDRREADRVFQELLMMYGNSKLKSYLFHAGVRLFGGGPYKRRQKKRR